MHKNTKRLLELREQHGFTGKRIAEILGVKHQTAMIWLMKESPRVIPFTKLYLLEVHLNGEFRKLD